MNPREEAESRTAATTGPPEVPTEPKASNVITGTAGFAVSIVILVYAAATETPEIQGIVSPDPDIPFPAFPQVRFYNYATGVSILATTLGASWEKHEIVPGLPGLTFTFSKPKEAPLKKGEILAICITG